MPILHTLNLTSVTDSEFERIDAAVMRAAYAIQNKFGRLFDERIYENAMAGQLRANGFSVHTQVPVHLIHAGYRKTLYLDLVVNEMVYELKAVSALAPQHDSQALQYAMLHDLRRIKLLNFGEPKVKGKLLRNAIPASARHQTELASAAWSERTHECGRLLSICRSLLDDWGTHLSSKLYTDALIHHFGGEAHCLKRTEVKEGENQLGTHLIQLFAPGHAFVVTTLTRDQTSYQGSLQTLLQHIDLQAIQWINLNHSKVELVTLDRGREAQVMPHVKCV